MEENIKSSTIGSVEQSNQEIKSNQPIKERGSFLPILIVILVLLIVSIGAYYYSVSKKQIDNAELNKNTSIVIETSPMSNEGTILAMRQGGTVSDTGDIILTSVDAKSKIKLTNSQNISEIYSFSPDNEYLLGNQGTNASGQIVIIKNDGSVMPVNLLGVKNSFDGKSSNFIWKNHSVIYVNENSIYQTNVDDNQSTKIGTLSQTQTANGYLINSGGNRILFDTDGGDAPIKQVNVFVYDIPNQKLIAITKEGGANKVGWSGSNVIYTSSGKIFTSDTNGKIISTYNLGEWDFNGGITFDDKVLYFAYPKVDPAHHSGQLFLYDQKLNTARSLESFNPGTFPANLTVSPDRKYISYDLAGIFNASSFVVNIKDGNTVKLCEASCYYPIWKN